MNNIEDSPITSNYQFPRWPAPLSRPQTSLPPKDTSNDAAVQLSIDNRNSKSTESTTTSTAKRIVQHHVRIPTSFRRVSSPFMDQTISTPDHLTTFDHSSSTVAASSRYRTKPVRMKSTSLTMPLSTTCKPEQSFQDFPKQTHEKRKITHERKRKKQQALTLAEKYSDSETWFQLRRSLAELKRLATAQQVLVDPKTSIFNCDGYSFASLKQIISDQHDDKRLSTLKSESGMSSSSFGSTHLTRELMRGSAIASHATLVRSQTARRSTETYPRVVFEPFIVTSKPIHNTSNTIDANNPPLKAKTKQLALIAPHARPHSTSAILSEKRRSHLLLSDLSNYDYNATSSTPSPPLIKAESDIYQRKLLTPSPTRSKAPSTIQLNSSLRFRSQSLRCHSAIDLKSSLSATNKNNPRFILITDEEHRIESWYHQYPFIMGDELLNLFESKQLQQKANVTAYFIDDIHVSKSNLVANISLQSLQGKPFNVNYDWRKYDIIFISSDLYEKLMVHLQTSINLIKAAGRIVQIYQVNHDEELKHQVKNLCKRSQKPNM